MGTDENANEIEDFPRTIIFVNESHHVDVISNRILYETGQLNSKVSEDMTQHTQLEEVEKFRKNLTSIMVATDLLASGADFSDVELVINYDLPRTLDLFIGRISRCGRLGNQGVAISFFDSCKDTVGALYLDEVCFSKMK